MAAEVTVDRSVHRPDARRAGGRWRVDCRCGWRGPVVALPGQGHDPYMAHLRASSGPTTQHQPEPGTSYCGGAYATCAGCGERIGWSSVGAPDGQPRWVHGITVDPVCGGAA